MYSWFSNDVTKIQTPKSQGLLRFYLYLVTDFLKINFCAKFQGDSVFHFENIALSNFPSLLRLTLIGTLRNYDVDDNENVRKAIGLMSETTTLHVHHALLYTSLHNYDVK